ncbi:hypothetical protein FRB98_009199 [Tulasnella sp. 332]|nr:hypothetical protein FRB98_009199 [Tulasnella sp. 332]
MITSTPTSPLGLRDTQGMTFERYTSIPFRPIRGGTNIPFTTEEFKALDWTTKYPRETRPRINALHKITMAELQQVKTQLKPAGHLNLSAMARNRVVPKPLLASQPYFKYDPFLSLSIRQKHGHIETCLLVNLHYSYRLRKLLQDWSALQSWENGVVDFLPDQQTLALVEQEATTAMDITWQRLKIYENEMELGLASWLWAGKGVADRAQSGETLDAQGSVLFTYAPPWIATKEILDDLCEHGELGPLNDPTWFSGMQATCQKFGARHLVIYTGEYLVVGAFSNDFTQVALSDPLMVACDDMYGEGVSMATNEMLSPFSNMDICLGQIVTQLMTSAQAASSVAGVKADLPASSSASQPPLSKLPFPLIWNVAAPVSCAPDGRTPLAIRFHDAKLRPTPYEKRPVRQLIDRSKAESSSNGSSEGTRGPALSQMDPKKKIETHEDFLLRKVVIKMIRPGPDHLKRPYDYDDFDDEEFRPAIPGKNGAAARRVVHPNMARLVRSATVLNLPLPESFRASRARRDGPPPSKRQRMASVGLEAQATFLEASSASSSSVAIPSGPTFFTTAARKRHADEIATEDARVARRRRISNSTPTPVTASTSAPICALNSASTSAATSNFPVVEKTCSTGLAGEKKVVAVVQAAKKDTFSMAFGAIKCVGVSIVSGVRYVLGAISVQSSPGTEIGDGENVAVKGATVDNSDFTVRSGKENPERTTRN